MNSNIERVELPDGVRWVLRKRPGMGGLQFIPLFLGTIFTAVGLAWMILAPAAALEPHPVLFRLGGAVPGLLGVAALFAGIFLCFGHAEIEHAGGQLRVVARAGPFSWTRRRSAAGLRLVGAIHTPGSVNDQVATSGPLADLSILRATWEGGSTMTLAHSYPLSWMRALADEFTALLGEAADPSTRPANSRAILRTHPGGLVLILPPAGLRKGSTGFLWLAIGWLLWIPACGALIYFLKRPDLGLLIGLGIMLGVLELLGVLLLGIAVHLGRQKVTFEVGGGRLRATAASPFSTRSQDWPLAEIRSIQCGASGHVSNGVPYMHLQITPLKGASAGFLTGRDTIELRWVADVLTKAIRSTP